MIDEIELSGIKYPLKCHEDTRDDGIISYTFSALVNDKRYMFKTQYTSSDINSPPIYGMSAKEVLLDIMYFEMKAELFGIVYNTTFKKQCEIVSECKTIEELLAASAHDSVFAAYMFNFPTDIS